MWEMESKGHSGAACENNGIVTIGTGKRFVYEEPLGTCDPYDEVWGVVVQAVRTLCVCAGVAQQCAPTLARVIGNPQEI